MATIDERLEALTHTVELIAGMQLQTEAVMKELAKSHLQHEDAIARLALIADSHENRISNLEGDE